MKNVKQYYKELGKVVCVLAKADGSIQREEADSLKQFVEKKLAMSEMESDSSGMNKAFYVDFEFDDESSRKSDTEAILKSFSSFVHRNFEPGDEKLIDQSISLLQSVAQAYREGSEEAIINLVKMEMRELSPQKNK